ncbi:thioredoxin family protein [Hanstruepera neustonica]|uniref:Thioredoxin family protein n=1 Tax=Hanstruepera neustonica TaxID=1445657 RepID=A0A2K1DW49_9FLAO|nr:thioredoxin family protein [Hanstruepera neustonica]PNQ72266.1 thioredoxin family protein [Hanstruepera neustonica]
MKTYFTILLLTVISFNTFSQNWNHNFKEAQLEAQKMHKPMILVFSGSDWCAPCIKLDQQIFQSDAFINYSDANVVLVKADFPRKKQNTLSEELQTQNRSLAEKYNKNGFFPLVLVLNESGKVLGEMGYEKIAPQSYVDKLKSFVK